MYTFAVAEAMVWGAGKQTAEWFVGIPSIPRLDAGMSRKIGGV